MAGAGVQQTVFLVAAVFLLDAVFGDPVYGLHPIRLLGRLLSVTESALRRCGLDGYVGGWLLFVVLAAAALGVSMGGGWALGRLHWGLALAWQLYMGWSLVALGDLCAHGRRVAAALSAGDLAEARKRVGCLVGRDTERMDGDACGRAAVESLSENLTDGVIAPWFYFIFFGLAGLVLFKVVSTMDSMVGYRNERYRRFGWCGARLDDVLNLLPARATWLVMVTAAAVMPGFSAARCWQVGIDQHGMLPGWNSGWSEAGAAGALGIRLVGPIWREGTIATEVWIGDPEAPAGASPNDIGRMIRLAWTVTVLFVTGAVVIENLISRLDVW